MLFLASRGKKDRVMRNSIRHVTRTVGILIQLAKGAGSWAGHLASLNSSLIGFHPRRLEGLQLPGNAPRSMRSLILLLFHYVPINSDVGTRVAVHPNGYSGFWSSASKHVYQILKMSYWNLIDIWRLLVSTRRRRRCCRRRHVFQYPIIQWIATGKRAGAGIQPWLTPGVVWNRQDIFLPLRTCAPEFLPRDAM